MCLINLSIDFKKVEILDNSGDKKLGTKGPGGRLSKSSDSSSSQKNSPQTSLLPNSKEQTNTPQLSQGSSEKGNYNQKNDQGESRKTVSAPVIKPENYVTKVKGNETTGIDDNALKIYKQFGISIIVRLIPITLAIIYKYLSYGSRKELKRRKNMKKVINLFGVNKMSKTVINSTDRKKRMQIIINSSSQKKQAKKFIKPVYREKSPLLNIYKLMQTDPMPFINLFFLLIFFVYKRHRDSIE
ncbi:hypothetical protein PCHAJ_000180400 [Plasmodium chabaudi chabaudi]|uniref:CIR protein n=1 Tax=Plasmodium chabaudi chabaudi TaxID=31271 RepID=A0A1C6YEE6_PLACU|nr:hypothetical protein PCHAJ_000180400 [Plasmodium chabaudi chabaudi]